MQHGDRPRALIEPLAELTEFPVGVSASRSIRDYETPSASHVLSSVFRPNSGSERVV
jgi:hypothetical protein